MRARHEPPGRDLVVVGASAGGPEADVRGAIAVMEEVDSKKGE